MKIMRTRVFVMRDQTTGKILAHGWHVVPPGMTVEEAFRTQHRHGPFRTAKEASESSLAVMSKLYGCAPAGRWTPGIGCVDDMSAKQIFRRRH